MDFITRLFYWLPRIICILAILFISAFAGDAFETGHSFWQQIAAFLIHLIPSFVLLALLIIAWRWEYIGGIIFIVIGIGMSPVIYLNNHNVNNFSDGECISVVMMTCLPFIVAGILFMLSHFRKKKEAGHYQ